MGGLYKVYILFLYAVEAPNVTRSVVMVSWFTHNYCACAPMLYISELCKDCAVANEIDYEIDYAWASIHDNGHVITACNVRTSTAHCFWPTSVKMCCRSKLFHQSQRIDATANTVFLHRQASGPHTYTLGREIKSPVQMVDFELMTYT